MKYLPLFLSGIIISINIFLIHSQVYVDDYWILDTTITGNKTYEAYDSIVLAPGFYYSPSGTDKFEARMCLPDISYIQQPDYGRELNTSLPVGSLPGTFDVSASGAATYSIPIEVPPGRAGMTPRIAITYNSNAGTGLLGRGWDISGISCISRVNRDVYHDEEAGSINLDGDDKYALDGNRLIAVDGTYGASGTEYRTEFEDFSRITSYGTKGSGPSYFIVETKDGSTLEYGNTYNSKIEAKEQTDVLFWYLNKIEDNYGNYIEFLYYENNSTGEVRPIEIKYTGNPSAGYYPDNSIVFTYEQKSDKNISYIAGSPVQDNVLLKAIGVKHKSTLIREYEFNYFYNHESQLAEIIQKGENGTACNSTLVEWGTYEDSYTETWKPSLTMDHTGDFNGDGYLDFINISGYNGLVYINNGDGINFTNTDTIDLPTGYNYQNLYVGDINGDLSEDVIMDYLSYPNRCFTPYLSDGTDFTAQSDSFYCSFSAPYKFHLADFNGDGKCEGILRYGDNYDVINFTLTPSFGFTVDSYYLEAYNDEISVSKSPEAIELDINGDNKAEIMFLGSNLQAHFYELTDDSLTHIFSQLVVSRTSFNFGDFNGDGKTDIAFPSPPLQQGPNNMWGIYYSTGTSLETSYLTIGDLSTAKNLIYSGDANGDGRTDLIFVGYGEQDGTELGMYVAWSTADSFEVVTYEEANVSSIEANAGDFNGDGMAELYNSYYFHGFFPNRDHCLVQSVTNGLNQKISFSYTPLTDADVYTKGSGAQYPVADLKGPLYVLSSATTGSGTGEITENSFTYSGAKLHQQGRGLLGFTKINASNSSTGLETIKTFEYNTDYFFPRIQKLEIKSSGDTAYVETYTNSVITNGNGRIFPYISETEKNYMLEDIVITTSFEYDTCGNVQKIITDYDGEASDTLTNTFIAGGSWCPSRITLSTLKKKRSGEDDYVLSSYTGYNDHGQPDTTINDINAEHPVTTVYEYDHPLGLLTKVTHSAEGMNARYQSMTYDTCGNIASKTNTLGQSVEMTWNGAYGNILSSTDVNDLVTSYQYDEFGRLKKTTLPDGSQVTYTIDWAEEGDPAYALYAVETERDGFPSQRSVLDSLGREIRREKTGFDGTAVFTDMEYNAGGRVYKISEPYYSGTQPEWTTYSYDASGRNTGISSPLGNTTISYNGRSVTTTNTSASPNQSVTRTIDPAGQLSTVTDAGGSVTYAYYSSGLPKMVTSPGGLVTSLEFDNLGNRTKISEPNAGTYTFEYNPFGEMISQNANDTVTELSYDNLGRIITMEELEGTTTFTYDTKDNGVGKLAVITSPDSVEVEFTYDAYSRLTSKTETIGSLDLTETKVYDRYGRDSVLVYPSGFAIKYIYNNNSYLSQIKRTSDNSLIWQANSMNARDQITGSTYGNSLVSQFSYDHGYVTGIKTGTIQHLQYGWDLGTGNLSWRKDSIRDMTENFTYDNLNRLTEITFGENTQNFAYSSNGNITSSTAAGSYTYDQDKPHAVTLVTNLADVADTTDQALEYTSFNKVKNIIQGSKELDIWYGANRQRVKTVFSDSAYQLTKYFAHGNYERETGDENRELHYIFAGTGIAAIMQRKNNVDSMFYVHPDHLGSLVLITDENGNVYEEKSFDAFGRMRDPEDWDEMISGGSYRFDRGYTGHEHLSAFGLINMNGRMYDPHTARFLSPDLFVQDPAFTQSFNRYSYCVNNPLRFVDPGGYWWNGLIDRVFHDGQTDWQREVHSQHKHLDSEGGYHYDPSSSTGYRSSSGQEVTFQEVYYKFILPNLLPNAFIDFEEYYYAGRGTRLGKNLIKVNPNGNLDVWSVFTTTFYGVVSFTFKSDEDHIIFPSPNLGEDYEITGIICPSLNEPVIQLGINITGALGHGFTAEAGIIIQGTKSRFYTTIGFAIGFDYSIGILMTITTSIVPNFNIYSLEGWSGSINGGALILDFGVQQNSTYIINPGPIYQSAALGFSIGPPAAGTFQWTYTTIY